MAEPENNQDDSPGRDGRVLIEHDGEPRCESGENPAEPDRQYVVVRAGD